MILLDNMKVLLGHLDWGLGTKVPRSDPADKTFLVLPLAPVLSNFLSFDSCVFIYCVFIYDKLKKISCCIYQYIQKQALRVALQDVTTMVNLFLQNWSQFSVHSLLNKKFYYLSEILRSYSSRVMVKKSILQLCRTTNFLAQL